MTDDAGLRANREEAARILREVVAANPSLQHAPTRDDLVTRGKQLWPLSYRHSDDDGVAFHRLLTEMANLETPLEMVNAAAFHYLPLEQIVFFFAARWADQGFPTVTMGHKYAAALMATSVPREAVADVRPPFHAFAIEVPQGLLNVLDHDGTSYDVTRVCVQHTRAPDAWYYVVFTTGRVALYKHGISTEMLTEEEFKDECEWDTYSFSVPMSSRDDRINFLVQRLILNVCLAMASKDAARPVGKAAGMGPGTLRSSPEPLVRTYKLGKPLKLDCRDAVRDYAEGVRPQSKLSVQVLVRGHWRRQAHGPEHSLRKWLWIEPFWRGPEDAPILARPHDLGR